MTEKDIAKLRKFSRFVFPYDFPRKDEEIDTLERQLQILIDILKFGGDELRRFVLLLLYSLDTISFFTEGGDFLSLDSWRAERVITRISTSQKKTVQGIFRFLRFLSTSSFWDSFGNAKVGFRTNGLRHSVPKIQWEEVELKRGTRGAEWDIERIRFGKYIRGDIRIVSDVVVVGSGISAGIVAERLAREDISVSIIEKGYFVDAEAPSVFLSQSSELFGAVPVSSMTNINALVGKGVGGLANLSFSIFERIQDEAKEIWRKEHGISVKDLLLDDMFGEAEEVINSKAVGEDTEKNDFIEKLAGVLLKERRRFRKLVGEKPNFITGENILSPEKFIKYATHFGANLYLGFEVEKISRSSRKWFLEGKIKDEEGNIKGSFIAEAKAVFLCGGTYGNARILLNSGFKEKTLGRKIKVHPAGVIIAFFNSPQEGSNSPDYIEIEDGVFLKEVRISPGVWSSLIPESAKDELVKRSKRYPFSRTFVFWFREEGEGRVVSTPLFRFVKSELKGEDIAKFLFAVREVSLALFSLGAKEIVPPIRGISSFQTPDDVEPSNIEKVKPKDIEMISFMRTGGCPMSFTSERGFVDSTGRVFGEKSLFVCDTSALPDSTFVPPMLTASALALISTYAFLDRKNSIL